MIASRSLPTALVPVSKNRYAGASGDPGAQSIQDRLSDIFDAQNPPGGSRRYGLGGIVCRSRPFRGSFPSSLRCTRYLPMLSSCNRPLPRDLLAIFSLRISSSLTTLSMIFFEDSSMTSTFHYTGNQPHNRKGGL